MANSEMRGNQSENAADAVAPHDGEGRAAQDTDANEKDYRSERRLPHARVIGASERDRMLAEARKVDFPTGLRGYERAAVDRYVERINRLLAELEMSSSPESAVRHALDEVSEETRDILQHAHQTADEITARSRSKADDRLQHAERAAQEVREAAQEEAKETREAAQHEAHELRELTTREAQNLREVAQQEAQNLRETAQSETSELRDATTQEMTDLKERSVRETQQLCAAAQREADETRETARRKADEMLESAETRTQELARSAEAIWRERRRLIDDMRGVESSSSRSAKSRRSASRASARVCCSAPNPRTSRPPPESVSRRRSHRSPRGPSRGSKRPPDRSNRYVDTERWAGASIAGQCRRRVLDSRASNLATPALPLRSCRSACDRAAGERPPTSVLGSTSRSRAPWLADAERCMGTCAESASAAQPGAAPAFATSDPRSNLQLGQATPPGSRTRGSQTDACNRWPDRSFGSAEPGAAVRPRVPPRRLGSSGLVRRRWDPGQKETGNRPSRCSASKRPRHHQRELFSPECVAV